MMREGQVSSLSQERSRTSKDHDLTSQAIPTLRQSMQAGWPKTAFALAWEFLLAFQALAGQESRAPRGAPDADVSRLLQAGYANVPYSSQESVIELNKQAAGAASAPAGDESLARPRLSFPRCPKRTFCAGNTASVLGGPVHHAKTVCQRTKPFVQRPQLGAWRHQGRGEQQQVDQTAAQPEQPFVLDEVHDFLDAGLPGRLQGVEIEQCSIALRWRSARDSPTISGCTMTRSSSSRVASASLRPRK